MANRTDLRSSLRAADKRRQRRTEAFAGARAQNHPAPASHVQSVDAVGEIVHAAVGYCQTASCHSDAVLVGGLRGFFKQSSPQREQTRGLYERLTQLADELVQRHPGFALRQFRKAVEELLETAKVYETNNPHDTRFLDYLELLSRG